MDDEAAFLRAKLKEVTEEHRLLSEQHAAFRAEAVRLVEAMSNDKLLFPPEGELAQRVLDFISTHKAV